MTKSRGVGRGYGGGRPRKNRVDLAQVVPAALTTEVKTSRLEMRLPALQRLTWAQMRELAQQRAELAVLTLQNVAQHDERGSARVAAAKELLALAFGTPGKIAQPDDEAEQQTERADATTTDFLLQ